MKKIFLIIFLSCFFFTQVEARLLFSDEHPVSENDALTIDPQDESNEVNLNFGKNLSAKIKFVKTEDEFLLNKSVDFQSNEIKNIRIENLAIEPNCDNSYVGKIYHNTNDNNSYICDGNNFTQINNKPDIDMATARYRDSSTTNLNAASTNNLVPWDTEDFEDSSVFIHDPITNNSRIQVLESGPYLISGSINVENSITSNFRYNGRVKFRINGTTVPEMRFQPGYIRQTSGQTETSLVFSSILYLSTNDYFEVLVDQENTTAGVANMISLQSSLSIIQLKGQKGSKGDTGTPGTDGVDGADGDITWQGTWVSQNYIKNQAVSYQGSSYVCILSTISSEDPSNTTYWELMASKGEKGEQGLPGDAGVGTDNETFYIDANDTGGNLALQFGTTLAETLSWNNTKQAFDLSDNLNILSSNESLKLGDGSSNDIYITFDDNTDHKIGWDDSANNFSTFGEDIESECGPYGIFWAERGTVVSNESWALGNGQSPFGSPMGCNGTVKKIAATCTGTIGTSLSAVLRKNNVATSCTVNLSTTVGEATLNSCNETFLGTDVLGVYAGTEVGTWTECVGTFWVKYD